jgi:hypothetical protein
MINREPNLAWVDAATEAADLRVRCALQAAEIERLRRELDDAKRSCEIYATTHKTMCEQISLVEAKRDRMRAALDRILVLPYGPAAELAVTMRDIAREALK